MSKKQTLLTLIMALATLTAWAQTDLKVGTTPGSISPSAVMEAASTTKGFLIPRMTTAQMNAISSPANGLQIYNTTDSCTYIYRNSLWMSTCSPTYSMAWGLLGNSGTNAGSSALGTAVDGNYLGTTNAQNLVFGTNSIKRMILDQNGNAYGGNTQTIGSSVTNTLVWGNNNNAYGNNQLIIGQFNRDSSNNSLIVGQNNILGLNTNHVILAGKQNTINTTYGNSYSSIFGGTQNTVNGDCYEGFITGFLNNVISSQKVNVNGQGNTVNGGTYSAVFGLSNTVSSQYGLVQGNLNTLNTSSDYGILLGQSNTIAASHANSMAIGRNMTTTASAQFAAGFTGGFRFHTNNSTNTSLAIDNVGNVGINTNTPQYKLDIDAQTGSTGNPLRLLGLNAGATSDSIISSNSGILRRLSINQILGNAWNITGNAGTTAGTNFIGTTDAQSLVFKTNNAEGMRLNTSGYLGIGTTTPSVQLDVVGRANILTPTNFNLFINGGNTITTGTYNTGIGLNTLANLTTGSYNVALVGLSANTTGSYNTAFGGLSSNTTGSSNAAFGSGSLLANTVGLHNAAFGTSALEANINGTHNTAIGNYALSGVTSGGSNIGLGWGAGNNITTGSDNIIIGFQNQAPSATASGQLNIGNLLYGTSLGTSTARSIGNIGINTTTPQYKLDIDAQTGSAGNPLRLLGLNAGATSDSIITSNSGILRRMAMNNLAWTLTGNSGTTAGTNFIGTTDAQDLVFKANNTEGMRLATSGYVGLGVSAPSAPLHLMDVGGTFGMRVDRYGSTGGPRLTMMYARGTRAAPTAVQSGDVLGRWITFGYNGSSFPTSNATTGIFIWATENHTTTANGSQISFQTIPNGGTTASRVMTIDQNGNVGVGTLPSYRLDIDGQTGSAGNPLRLLGLNAGATSDSIISSNSGILRRLSINQILANAWTITGNSGTVDGTNFIGTTDNVPFNIRVNNQKAGRIDPTNTNAFFGYQAGNVTSGFGTNNTFIGHQAGVSNTSGRENLFMGYQAGNTNTTSNANHFIGFQAGYGNTSGSENTAEGYQSGYGLTTGSYNAFFGKESGKATNTGFENVGLGYQALKANTSSNGNVAIGTYALLNSVTGGDNVAVGRNALKTSTGAAYNVTVGSGSMANGLVSGNYNTALGNSTLAALTTGTYNIGVGASALNANTTGTQNIAIGGEAALNNITGSSNTVMGYQAGRNGTAVANSTIIGYQSGMGTTGGNNTFLGYQTGTTNTTGSSNTLLGYNANVGAAGLTNASAIGANATVGASNSLVLGGTGANAVNVGINTTTPQYKLDIDGMTGSAGNPLRLQGLNIGANTDSMVTTLNGVVRQIPVSLLITRFNNNFWSLTGNGGTSAASNFVGTTDANDFVTKTNNTEVMRATSGGNIGIATATPSSTLQVNGSFSTALTTKTAAYTATSADHIIIGNATTGAFTVTLPTAVGVAGRQYIIKKTDSSANAVTVATTAAQTIDGATTVTISIQWQTKTFVSDGTNWLIISNQ